MDAQLMGPPGAGPQLEPGTTIRGAANTVVGDCPLSGGIDNHAPAAASTELSKPGLDPPVGLGRAAFDNGPIDFGYLPTGLQRAEPPQRLRVPPQYQAAAGIAVEAVGESRRVRQPEPQLVKAAFEIGTPAGAGMDGDPRRLVDDEDQTVAIKDAIGESPLTPALSPQAGGGSRAVTPRPA
jgi:hypothetical protein